MKVILAAHVVWDKGFENNGPAHIVARYLESKRLPFYFLKFPLYENHPAEVSSTSGVENVGKTTKNLDFVFFRAKYLTNVLTTLNYVGKLPREDYVFIGVDPLNALSGLLLRRLGKVEVFVFHTPDYSPKKFDNPILNFIYHAIDKFCAKKADFVWGVSQRIIEKRKSQGVDEKKLFRIPNSPPRPFADKAKGFPKNPILVSLSNLSNSLTFESIFRALNLIKVKFPGIRLLLIGSGKKEDQVKRLAKTLEVYDLIEFTGWLPYDQAIEKTKTASAGLAFYSNKVSWTKYCDPVKVRDYLACGLPVIMNDVPTVAEEIRNNRAGVVCKDEPEAIAEAVSEILKDEKSYKEYSKNALKLAKERSSKGALDGAFDPILKMIVGSPLCRTDVES